MSDPGGYSATVEVRLSIHIMQNHVMISRRGSPGRKKWCSASSRCGFVHQTGIWGFILEESARVISMDHWRQLWECVVSSTRGHVLC